MCQKCEGYATYERHKYRNRKNNEKEKYKGERRHATRMNSTIVAGSETGMSGLGLNRVRLAPNGTNLRLFKIFQFIKMY